VTCGNKYFTHISICQPISATKKVFVSLSAFVLFDFLLLKIERGLCALLFFGLRSDHKNIKIGFIINTALCECVMNTFAKCCINLSEIFGFGFCHRQYPKQSIADLLGRESSKSTNYEKKS